MTDVKKQKISMTTDYGYFYCLKCKMNLCPLCKSVHDKNHYIINYDNKFYIFAIYIMNLLLNIVKFVRKIYAFHA